MVAVQRRHDPARDTVPIHGYLQEESGRYASEEESEQRGASHASNVPDRMDERECKPYQRCIRDRGKYFRGCEHSRYLSVRY